MGLLIVFLLWLIPVIVIILCEWYFTLKPGDTLEDLTKEIECPLIWLPGVNILIMFISLVTYFYGNYKDKRIK